MTRRVIGDLLRERSRERGDHVLWRCGDDTATYAEADERSDRVAAGIASIGVKKGDRIAILAPNRPEVLELYFACAKLGAVQVPLNAFLKGEFLRYQLADCGASVLVTDEQGYEAAAPLLSELPALKHVVALDGRPKSPTSVHLVPYAGLAASGPAPPEDVEEGDLMSIVYTSGTTGLPKGCMLPHAYYCRVARLMCEAWEIREGDVIMTALPLFHGAARMMMVAAALWSGQTVVVEREFRPASFLERISEVGATIVGGVGAMGVALLSLPPSPYDRSHHLRLAMWIPFSVEQQLAFEERFAVSVTAELYGQTECVPITFSAPRGDRNRASAGKPAPDLEVLLVDDEDRPVQIGEVGEIVVRPREPYAIFSGYWQKPEETLRSYRNLWYHTGDYGRADARGFITFVDRKKDAIRRRGENVSSVELELAIARHPKIAEAAVHAVPSQLTEDDIKACVVLKPDESVSPDELFVFFQEHIPYYAIPRYVEILPQLPKNAVGRVMKYVLRERGVTPSTWDLDAMGFKIPRSQRR